MKTGNCSRIWWVGLLVGIFPLTVAANEPESPDLAVSKYLSFSDIKVVDSIPAPKRQDDKDKKKQTEKDKPKVPKEEPKTVDVDPKRPDIKQVPKSRPKLRPGVVDRVKVPKPNIKKGGR